MTGYAFTLADARLTALPSGALHWPAQNLLIVSDLHFGKSERLARRGGSMLPPYDTRATLTRLHADLAATDAVGVLCLGDSFDDPTAALHLHDDDRDRLARLMAGRDWTWVLGNHDPTPMALEGRHLAETRVGPLAFRHIATEDTPEISGHYHPKASVGTTTRACFLLDSHRVIMPAYGSYTGGLPCHDPALTSLLQPSALAILTGTRAIAVPMPRAHKSPRASSLSR